MLRRILLVLAFVTGCSSSESSAPLPAAPRLVEAAAMGDALHLTWVNEERSCDAIEIERRTDKEFAVVYTVPGAVDNKHDASASENVTYLYRLRCKKNGVYSPYSNELGANPKV